ncbi:TPA: hypothetical protein ACIZBH_003022, partial [Legionella pneumophila]
PARCAGRAVTAPTQRAAAGGLAGVHCAVFRAGKGVAMAAAGSADGGAATAGGIGGGVAWALAAGALWGLVFVAPLMLPEYPAALQSVARYQWADPGLQGYGHATSWQSV